MDKATIDKLEAEARAHVKRVRASHVYVECSESDVPAGVRFDVPGSNQGQIVEVAYGAVGSRYEAGEGDPWQRVTDRSDGKVTYYRRKTSKTKKEG